LIDYSDPYELRYATYGLNKTFCCLKYKSGYYSSIIPVTKSQDIPRIFNGETMFIIMGSLTLFKHNSVEYMLSHFTNTNNTISDAAKIIIEEAKTNMYDNTSCVDNMSVSLLKIRV
jgi:serine/threonine protein phosphatase PrpC